MNPSQLLTDFEKALKKTGYVTGDHKIGKCRCGHTGGAPNTDHVDTPLERGHGRCRKCDCPQFTWVGLAN